MSRTLGIQRGQVEYLALCQQAVQGLCQAGAGGVPSTFYTARLLIRGARSDAQMAQLKQRFPLMPPGQTGKAIPAHDADQRSGRKLTAKAVQRVDSVRYPRAAQLAVICYQTGLPSQSQTHHG